MATLSGEKPKKETELVEIAYDPTEHPERAEHLAAAGHEDFQIAQIFGILASDLKMWQHRHQELDDAILRGRASSNETMIPDLKRALIRKALEGNVQAGIFLLKNMDPQNFKEKQTHEITAGTPDDYAVALKRELEDLRGGTAPKPDADVLKIATTSVPKE